MSKLRNRINGCCREAPPSSDSRHILRDYLPLPECRFLFHHIHSTQNETGIKSILILSQFPKEGRTFLTSVLAVAAANLLNQRVLIVDTLSDTPTESPFYHYFVTDPSRDVSHPKKNSSTPHIVLAKRIGHNGALTSDPQERDASEEIASPTPDFDVGAYLTSARDYYDLILIDGCALQAIQRDTLHPSILASHSDSTIIVASARGIERSALTSLKGLLTRHRISPLGLVFNRGPVA